MATAQPNKTTPKDVREKGNKDAGESENGKEDAKRVCKRLDELEARMRELEEEKESMKREIRDLRDRLEETEWQKQRLEDKLEGKIKEVAEGQQRLEGEVRGGEERERSREDERLKKIEEKISEVEERQRNMGLGGGGGGGEEEERLKRIEERLDLRGRKEKEVEKESGENWGNEVEGKKIRCIVFTNSNGRDATEDTIKIPMAREERNQFAVEVVVAYTIEEAYRRVESGSVDVRGARVIIDTLTNEARGMRARRALTPDELVHRVHRLRRILMSAGATGVVTCQLKPMEVKDVGPYNDGLHRYLQEESRNGRGGYGCRTQIRLGHLRSDGYHIKPTCEGIICRTYACAILGINVPCPTRDSEFTPTIARRRWESEWPSLGVRGGTQSERHGWKW